MWSLLVNRFLFICLFSSPTYGWGWHWRPRGCRCWSCPICAVVRCSCAFQPANRQSITEIRKVKGRSFQVSGFWNLNDLEDDGVLCQDAEYVEDAHHDPGFDGGETLGLGGVGRHRVENIHKHEEEGNQEGHASCKIKAEMSGKGRPSQPLFTQVASAKYSRQHLGVDTAAIPVFLWLRKTNKQTIL